MDQQQDIAPLDRGSQSGLSLVELLIVTSVLLLVLEGVVSILDSSQEAFRVTAQSVSSGDRFRQVVERISFELRFCDPASIDPDLAPDSPSVSYSRVIGWDGQNSIAGPTQTISFASGQILFDGVVVATGAKDLTFNRVNGSLVIVLEYESPVMTTGTEVTKLNLLTNTIVL